MPKKLSKKEMETPYRSRAIRFSKNVKKAAKKWIGAQKRRKGWPFQ